MSRTLVIWVNIRARWPPACNFLRSLARVCSFPQSYCSKRLSGNCIDNLIRASWKGSLSVMVFAVWNVSTPFGVRTRGVMSLAITGGVTHANFWMVVVSDSDREDRVGTINRSVGEELKSQ